MTRRLCSAGCTWACALPENCANNTPVVQPGDLLEAQYADSKQQEAEAIDRHAHTHLVVIGGSNESPTPT